MLPLAADLYRCQNYNNIIADHLILASPFITSLAPDYVKVIVPNELIFSTNRDPVKLSPLAHISADSGSAIKTAPLLFCPGIEGLNKSPNKAAWVCLATGYSQTG